MRQVLSLSIDKLTSAVFDNGRRGMPKPGCDCEQCFGYCLVDQEAAARSGFGAGAAKGPVMPDGSLELG